MTELTASPGITLTIDLPALLNALGAPSGYDYDDEPMGQSSLREQIVGAVRDDLVAGLRKPVADQTRVAIAAEVQQIVREVLSASFPKVSRYGEVSGQTTLREAIAEEVRTYIQGRGVGYDNKQPMKDLLRQEVDNAMTRELREAIAQAKATVIKAVQDKGAAMLAQSLGEIAERGR